MYITRIWKSLSIIGIIIGLIWGIFILLKKLREIKNINCEEYNEDLEPIGDNQYDMVYYSIGDKFEKQDNLKSAN